jgi:hypothetical protein
MAFFAGLITLILRYTQYPTVHYRNEYQKKLARDYLIAGVVLMVVGFIGLFVTIQFYRPISEYILSLNARYPIRRYNYLTDPTHDSFDS